MNKEQPEALLRERAMSDMLCPYCDDDGDAHLNGLAGRIDDARKAVQAEELP